MSGNKLLFFWFILGYSSFEKEVGRKHTNVASMTELAISGIPKSYEHY